MNRMNATRFMSREVGDRYAENVLLRMANHILAGTIFENKAWELDRRMTCNST